MTPDLDSVQLAVLSARFKGIVKQMANTLFRTGRAGVINTAHDFSCCIITGDGEFLTMADSLPIHVMRGSDRQAQVMKEFHPDLRAGDAFLHNSPYHGNTHAGDFGVLVPVVDRDGVHRFTCVAKAHISDVGNSIATTQFASARDIYEEGALFFAATKVQDGYENIEDIIRLCRMRIRQPDQWYGDYLAILGSVRTGERRILELGEEVGWDVLDVFTRQWFDYSEQMMIAALKRFPRGEATVRTDARPVPERARRACRFRRRSRSTPTRAGSRSTCATTPTACRTGSTRAGRRSPPTRRSRSSTASGTPCRSTPAASGAST